jgi:3'-phosphoadenosine 5'-phosphosulfate sulfotransferase (PAPS reductase)/FAD synthetase
MSCYKRGEEQQKLLIERGLIENNSKGKTYVCFSGGKDSTAMLLKLIEKKIPFDEVVFADTLFEYPELYSYIDYVEKLIGITITRLKPPSNTWDKWFYGKVTRGNYKGKVRGYPLVLSPCYYSRETKLNPMTRYMKDAKTKYIGIAFDEKRRLKTTDPTISYPLADWEMTEKDCAEYLDSKGLHNPIYDRYNRSGCFLCQKQGQYGLFMLWTNSKELWNKTKFYDDEARRLTGRGGFLDYKTKDEVKLFELEEKFNNGFIPKNNLKFECGSCKVFSEKHIQE